MSTQRLAFLFRKYCKDCSILTAARLSVPQAYDKCQVEAAICAEFDSVSHSWGISAIHLPQLFIIVPTSFQINARTWMSIYKRVCNSSWITLFLLRKAYFKRTIAPLPFFQLVSFSPQNFFNVSTIISVTLYNFLNYLIKFQWWLHTLHLVKNCRVWVENLMERQKKTERYKGSHSFQCCLSSEPCVHHEPCLPLLILQISFSKLLCRLLMKFWLQVLTFIAWVVSITWSPAVLPRWIMARMRDFAFSSPRLCCSSIDWVRNRMRSAPWNKCSINGKDTFELSLGLESLPHYVEQ